MRYSSGAQDAKAPFDLWLERKLHDLYDDAADAPLPADLLDLVRQLDQTLARRTG